MMKKLVSNLVWQIDIPISLQEVKNSVHVDLGSGLLPRNPFGAHKIIATDISETHLIKRDQSRKDFEINFVEGFDLTKPFHFKSNSVSSFSAYDVIEHIPRWERMHDEIIFPFVRFMSEIYRCLIPGGVFLAVTPFYPRDASFVDPTHINHISEKTVDYFCNIDLVNSLTSSYGFHGTFEKVCCFRLRGPGPFLQFNQRLESIRKSNSSLVFFLKLNKRLVKLLGPQKATHLLWVLKKPS